MHVPAASSSVCGEAGQLPFARLGTWAVVAASPALGRARLAPASSCERHGASSRVRRTASPAHAASRKAALNSRFVFLGFNYGLVFTGWGITFFVPQLAGYIKDTTGNLDLAFYISGGLLATAVIVSRFLYRPR